MENAPAFFAADPSGFFTARMSRGPCPETPQDFCAVTTLEPG